MSLFTKNSINLKKSLIGAGILLSLSAGAMAGPGMYKQLDLTDEQKEVLKEQRSDKKQHKQAFKKQMQAIQKSKMALLENYSEQQANKVADQIAELAKQKALSRMAHQQAVYKILNDEQKEKFKEIQAKHKGPFDHKKKRCRDKS